MISVSNAYVKDSNPIFIKEYISNILDEFRNELERLAEVFFNYPFERKGIDGKQSQNDVFALIERSYVGILNNAVIRRFSNDNCLQEFSIYNGEKYLGRCDLVVMHYDSITEKNYNLLIEAKASYSSWKTYSAEETKSYYAKAYRQAYHYYRAEKSYYSERPVIVTIYFDWVRDKSLLEKILEGKSADELTDFYSFFHTEEAGLEVYGTFSDILLEVTL